MTRKDYIKIGDVIIKNPDIYQDKNFISDLCDALENDNPNFNRDGFNNYIEEGFEMQKYFEEEFIPEVVKYFKK